MSIQDKIADVIRDGLTDECTDGCDDKHPCVQCSLALTLAEAIMAIEVPGKTVKGECEINSISVDVCRQVEGHKGTDDCRDCPKWSPERPQIIGDLDND